MHLTPANLAYFLMDRGLLGADEIVAGRISVVDASRRNRNFKVIRNGAPGLFVKQMRDMQTDAMLTLKREAACYELARDVPALSRLMPRLIRYDESRHTLVMELLPEAESLLAYHGRNKGFPVEIGRMLGEGLGVYHSQAGALLENDKLKALLQRHIPVILTLSRGGHTMLGHFGHIGPVISALLQQHKDFEGLLDALGAEWRFDSLIHGDMKWDNVLVFPAGEWSRLPYRRLGDGRFRRRRLGRRRSAAELPFGVDHVDADRKRHAARGLCRHGSAAVRGDAPRAQGLLADLCRDPRLR